MKINSFTSNLTNPIKEQLIADHLTVSYAAASSILKSNPRVLYLSTMVIDSFRHQIIKAELNEPNNGLAHLNSELYSPDGSIIFSVRSIENYFEEKGGAHFYNDVLFDYNYAVKALSALSRHREFCNDMNMIIAIEGERQSLELLYKKSYLTLKYASLPYCDLYQ